MGTMVGMRDLGHAQARRGFTLVELLVGLIVSLLVLTGVHRIFIAGINTQNTASLQTEVNRKAQVAADTMISKLRGSRGVIDDSANRIWFEDQDGKNGRYWVSNGTLYQYVGAAAGSYSGGTPLATNVAQLQFTYLNEIGQPAASEDDAYTVVVELAVTQSRHTARLKSAARLRNK
jgi:prepilin-type N-terminal cleavage/methylation domain-containing protein